MAESLPWGERFLIGGLAAVAALAGMAACDPEADAAPLTEPAPHTISYDGVTYYPVCELEDCSDQPDQVGVWINAEGQHWLSLGEYSLLIE